MNEPKTVIAGDTIKWSESFSDYPATTYTLTYTLKGQEVYTVTASANGSDYSITISSTDSDTYIPGFYQVIGVVSKTGERYTVSQGTMEVLPNPSEAKAGEILTHARQVVKLLEDAILKHATNPIEEITIAGRTLRRPKLSDLVAMRNRYLMEVKREEQAERISKGLSGGNKILTRFV